MVADVGVTEGVKPGALTVCINGWDVLPEKLASPPYTPVIECGPLVSVDVDNVAWPLPLRGPVPMLAVPSINVTVPVGVPAPGATATTAAVKVTGCAVAEGFTEDVNVVALLDLFTVCVNAVEVLPRKTASPPYTTVMECDPTASVEMFSTA